MMIKLLLSLVAGMILGGIFFGGLWLTVQKGLKTKNPALIFLVSFVIRMAVILVVFYYVVRMGWEYLLVCLAGFLIARFVVTRLTGRSPGTAMEWIKEAKHEN